LIFNYFDHKQVELIKNKAYSKMLDLEIENRNKSSYEEFFGRSALEQVRR